MNCVNIRMHGATIKIVLGIIYQHVREQVSERFTYKHNSFITNKKFVKMTKNSLVFINVILLHSNNDMFRPLFWPSSE